MICIGALSFLIAYFSMINIISYKALMFVLIFSSYIFSTELIHQISHRKKDKKAGIKSFPGVYGIRNSLGFFQIVQLIVIASSLYLLYSNFYLNVIFFGTILFSLLRILKVKNLNIKEADFEKMRDHMYGLYEGVYYLLCLSLF